MTLLTSVLGSLPRSEKVLNQFRHYEQVYQNPAVLAILEEEATQIILTQERLGLDIVNDGEIQRSGYFSAFYDSFEGYLPTGIAGQTLLDDGRYWDHHRGQCYRVWEQPKAWGANPAWSKYGAVIVDKLTQKTGGFGKSVFYQEARLMKKIASKPVKLTLPSPYQIMRRSWHPIFSRDAYPSQEQYLEDIIRQYKIIIEDCEHLGISVIQFDDDIITLLLDSRLRLLLRLEREIDLCVSSLNELFSHIHTAKSATHICRAIIHKDIPWSEANFLEMMLKNLRCNQFSVALNDTGADLLPFKHFPVDTHLLFGVIYSNNYILESFDIMFGRLKSVMAYIPLDQIILTSNCGFSPYARARKGLTLVWNKLSQLVKFAAIINEAGLSEKEIVLADRACSAFREQHEQLVKEELG